MADELNINGYVCSSKEVYNKLTSMEATKGELKKLDKNNDNIISEDELVEIQMEEEQASSGAISDDIYDDPNIKLLQNKQDAEENKKASYEMRLSRLRAQRTEAKGRLNAYTEDSAAYNRAQEALDRIQGEIDSINSKIATCTNNIASLGFEISTAIDNLQNQNSSSSPVNTNAPATSALSSTSPVFLNVQAGSGKELASVTGELSVCLDNVAKSLGTDRQGAADYITTLCNTVGNGYFNPKVILSQIYSESSGQQSCSTTATSKFVGLGQMSEVAVKEINRQFGTNFSFSDMDNPAKNLEAMMYLMRYQYERYGHNLGAAITAYNVGHFSGTVNNYANRIMSRV